MKRALVALATGVVALALIIATRAVSDAVQPEPTAYPTYTAQPTQTPYPTYTVLPTSTHTPTPTSTPTNTPTPTPIPEYPTMKGVGDTYGTFNWNAAGLGEWGYDWSDCPPRIGNAEMVPMVYDERFIGKHLQGNSEWAMIGNELDVPSQHPQGVKTTRQWAVYWRRIETIYPTRKLTTPCMMNIAWLRQWIADYEALYGRPPRFEAVCVHPYPFQNRGLESVEYSIAESKRIVLEAVALAEEHDAEVWVAEFATLPSYGDIGQDGLIRYMREMVQFFRQQQRVTRYAWFQVRYRCNEKWAFGLQNCTTLVDFATNRLMPLGEAYKD